MKSLIFLVILLAMAVSFANGALDQATKVKTQGTVSDRSRLVADLFRNYRKNINPDNVKLKFGMALISFDIAEERQVMESYIWFREVWTDSRLTWDRESYNVDVLRLDADAIWKPDITLYNSADPLHIGGNCWQSNVLIYPNGEVLWVPPCKLQSFCKLDRQHPYGEQTCSMKFGSWTYDGTNIDLQLYVGDNYNAFDMSDMYNNTSPYEVVSVTSERQDAYYPCCVESYPYVQFNLTVRRLPGKELFKRFSPESTIVQETPA